MLEAALPRPIKRSFVESLAAIPDVGTDNDFGVSIINPISRIFYQSIVLNSIFNFI
jgi:hypothetical protein